MKKFEKPKAEFVEIKGEITTQINDSRNSTGVIVNNYIKAEDENKNSNI